MVNILKSICYIAVEHSGVLSSKSSAGWMCAKSSAPRRGQAKLFHVEQLQSTSFLSAPCDSPYGFSSGATQTTSPQPAACSQRSRLVIVKSLLGKNDRGLYFPQQEGRVGFSALATESGDVFAARLGSPGLAAEAGLGPQPRASSSDPGAVLPSARLPVHRP